MHTTPAKSRHERTRSPVEQWRFWCRLCAEEDTDGSINILHNDQQESTSINNSAANSNSNIQNSHGTLTASIERFLRVQIRPSDKLPKVLCSECFSLVLVLEKFAKRVTKVQQMFRALQNTRHTSKLDLHAVRLKYCLSESAHEGVFPEDHYIEDSQQVNEPEEKLFEVETMSMLTEKMEKQSRTRIKIKKEDCPEEFHSVCVSNEVEELAYIDEDITEDYLEKQHDPFNTDDANDLNDDAECKQQISLIDASNSEAEDEDSTYAILRELAVLHETPEQRHTSPKSKCKLEQDSDDSNMNVLDEASTSNDTCIGQSTLDTGCSGNEEIHVCDICPREFKVFRHFRQHMLSAHSETIIAPELKCERCTRVFNTPFELKRHAKRHMPRKRPKVVPCPYCGKQFIPSSMRRHVKAVHMDERPFICEECGLAVHSNCVLKEHMLTHTNDSPFECEVCQKRFKNRHRLQNHIDIHNPNKYACPECGAKLSSRATLKFHLLTHSDEKQHKCDYCGQGFKRSNSLKDHLILHTGLKPYSCDFCDLTFASRPNCRAHKKKTHPEELAALEAAGGGKSYTLNIPKLEALKAVVKAAQNLEPVVSKIKGFRRPKKRQPRKRKTELSTAS